MQNIELFAYLDINDPLVEWEVAVGRLCSSCDLVRSKFGVSLWFYSNIKNKVGSGKTDEFLNELALEDYRLRHYPRSVSRLRGLFFFKSREMLESAFSHWGKPYNPDFISQVNFSASNLTEVDSEWISKYLRGLQISQDWMESYWKGDSYWENPVTEIIASGIGVVVNNDLRKRAYDSIVKKHPLASKILAFSAAQFFSKIESAGLVSPSITMSNGKFSGSYYINLDTFKGDGKHPSMTEVLEYCSKQGVQFPYNPECDIGNDIHLPDFKSQFEFSAPESIKIYKSVHEI